MNRFLFALTIVSCLVAAASSSPFIDSNDANIENVAELVCKTTKGTKNLLSRYSTLEKLVDYLGSVTSQHKLYQCRTQYLESLEQLVHVVKTSADDVCGEEKLNLIESFHRRYVSKVSKYLKAQKRANKAPKMAKLFFMQYASDVSLICEQAAVRMLASNKHSISSEDVSRVEELRKFTDTLGMTDLKHGYKRLYLFWNVVDSLKLAENDRFARYLNADGNARLNVQMKDARGINALQTLCRKHLKPVYSKSILPVLRFVDMGYYPQNGQLLDDLANDATTRGVFFATQICETLMPIAVFSDDKLDGDAFVAITKDEASKLSLPEVDEIVDEKPIEIESESLNTSQLILHETDLDVIKYNVASRNKVLNVLLKNLVKQIKTRIGAAFKGFKLFRKNQDRQLEAMDIDPAREELSNLQIEEEPEEGLMRKKRVVGPIIVASIFIWWFTLTLIKIVLLPLPTIILTLLDIFGWKSADRYTRKMWSYGY